MRFLFIRSFFFSNRCIPVRVASLQAIINHIFRTGPMMAFNTDSVCLPDFEVKSLTWFLNLDSANSPHGALFLEQSPNSVRL